MRTLNRPMFRYGGPIKEGVMHGIREPKRHGGSMGNNLVGSPAYPKTGGREHHAVVTGTIATLAAANAARIAAQRAAVRYGPRIAQGIKRIFGKTTPASVTRGGERIASSGSYSPVTMNPAKFTPNWLGSDPLVKGLGWAGKTLTSGPAKSIAGKVFQGVTAPTTLIGGLWFANGRWFNKDGSPANEEAVAEAKASRRGVSGAPGGGDPDMTYTAPEKELTEAEIEAAKIAARKKQMDMYKEIMDIKGMKKDAVYKSLIDVSKQIQEGGSLKEQLKSGSLISNLTQAASKRFDKVADTETALRSLVAKGEIENQLNKEDKDLKREALKGQIEINKKALAGLTTGEMIQKILGRAQGEYPKGDALRQIISINNPQLDAKVLPTGDMPTGSDALEYATTMINKRNNDKTTSDYPEGVYIIKDRVIQVIDGQVIPIPINKL